MNYDNINLIHDYWKEKIIPYLSHNMNITSFEDYLNRFSYLPSGNWMHRFELISFLRVPFLINPVEFVKQYESKCVSFFSPSKPEEGVYRIIYQISNTLHVDAALWMWVEQKEVQAYVALFVCFNNDAEFLSFSESMEKFKLIGDTENIKTFGFAGGVSENKPGFAK